MEETPVRWTVDAEQDWGGRTNGTLGITKGIPKILDAFGRRRIRGLFFISTELIRDYKRELFAIRDKGHLIGSHGHFHQRFRPDRALQDAEISLLILNKTFGPNDYPFRAPKFSYSTSDVYSRCDNHVGLLKAMWLGQKVTDKSILYLHPFDIMGGDNPPNLFCRLWYSRPRRALELFESWCEFYS